MIKRPSKAVDIVILVSSTKTIKFATLHQPTNWQLGFTSGVDMELI